MTKVNLAVTKKGDDTAVDVYVDGIQLFDPADDGSFNVGLASGQHSIRIDVGAKPGDVGGVVVSVNGSKLCSITATVPPEMEDDWSPTLAFQVP